MTTTASSPVKSPAFPWQDRRGRLSWLKLAVFAALFVPALFIAGQWAGGDLMPRPLNAVIHLTGLWGMRLLLLSLCLTPLRAGLAVPEFALLRRMLGLGAFAYIAAHFLLYVGDQAFDPVAIVAEIVGRFYLTIGFIALIGLCLLAATSTDGMVRRLGGVRWRRLHRMTYGIGLLALVHFFMQSKADPAEATVAAGLYLWALARRRWSSPVAILPLVAVSGLGAALAEALFFFALRGIDPLRVLAANLDVEFGLRPALWAGLIAAAVEVAGLIRRRAARTAHGAPRPAAPRRAGSAP
ncbi:sulfite oxidase heme-binding subunit YedZ [Zavarzinia aquatilis]|uniref:Protein-methionine-sulfoxide reductase heme-binding subunit MsrQ n=1 Tax=Zavarzinia aquatilis TaxID=2211142 RepID=A0A317EKA4_9PROT|nr:ferric reductase-like transmembrane domain-containing protein [Zavarzinia aquatilis]PWR25675.1 sulfoxide reductase heme-binding subunit YedZ [Zavarzinia aquatilis]